MKEFKGTPGPWVNVGGWVDSEKRHADLSGIICSISAVAARNPESINEANANLIAAAPDLLAALLSIINMDYQPTDDESDKVYLKARAAISKALGEG